VGQEAVAARRGDQALPEGGAAGREAAARQGGGTVQHLCDIPAHAIQREVACHLQHKGVKRGGVSGSRGRGE
jgi:hypothetical protein